MASPLDLERKNIIDPTEYSEALLEVCDMYKVLPYTKPKRREVASWINRSIDEILNENPELEETAVPFIHFPLHTPEFSTRALTLRTMIKAMDHHVYPDDIVYCRTDLNPHSFLDEDLDPESPKAKYFDGFTEHDLNRFIATGLNPNEHDAHVRFALRDNPGRNQYIFTKGVGTISDHERFLKRGINRYERLYPALNMAALALSDILSLVTTNRVMGDDTFIDDYFADIYTQTKTASEIPAVGIVKSSQSHGISMFASSLRYQSAKSSVSGFAVSVGKKPQ